MSCQREFIKILRQKGYRQTPQRMVVLEVLHNMPGYNSAEQVWDSARQLDPAIDRSTVYRTLEFLRSLEMVSVLEREGDLRRYILHVGQTDHFHLLCIHCGRVLDASSDLLSAFINNLYSQVGFKIETSQLTLSGVCQECARSVMDP